jgi:UPF0042 nucleotide-binding protein
MSGPTNCKDNNVARSGGKPLVIKVVSFGYKQGSPPLANLTFDVRFLKNPFWIDELRPLTGKDKPVQDYVMQQALAQDFLKSVIHMLDGLVPELSKQDISDFAIAFGCTGGQHRSATLVETLACELTKRYEDCRIVKEHRELDGKESSELLSGAVSQHASGTLVREDED